MADSNGKRSGFIKPRTDIDWTLARDFYVAGILVENPKTGTIERHYPSFAECGRRFKCSAQSVHYHAKRENWKHLRELHQKGEQEYIAERAGRLAAMSIEDITDRLDTMIRKSEGTLEIRSMADLKAAVELKLKLDQAGRRPTKTHSAISLEDLRARHERAKQADSATPEMAGIMDPAV